MMATKLSDRIAKLEQAAEARKPQLPIITLIDPTPEQYAQEYECSFTAAIVGAYFGKEMADIRLGINVDAVGAKGSKTAVSAYNLGEDRQGWLNAEIAKYRTVERGPEWVEGDHSIFVFQGVPCLAVTSSNLREGVMAVSHTSADTLDGVERELLVETADFIAELGVGHVFLLPGGGAMHLNDAVGKHPRLEVVGSHEFIHPFRPSP